MADSPDQQVTFHTADPYGHVPSTSEVSAGETVSIMAGDIDPFDFSYYMDKVRDPSLPLVQIILGG